MNVAVAFNAHYNDEAVAYFQVIVYGTVHACYTYFEETAVDYGTRFIVMLRVMSLIVVIATEV